MMAFVLVKRLALIAAFTLGHCSASLAWDDGQREERPLRRRFPHREAACDQMLSPRQPRSASRRKKPGGFLFRTRHSASFVHAIGQLTRLPKQAALQRCKAPR
jgi:hypothetical protein